MRVVIGWSIAPTARGMNHEHIAGVEKQRPAVAEGQNLRLLRAPIAAVAVAADICSAALHPVRAHVPGKSAGQTKGGHLAPIGEHGNGHGLEKANAAHNAIPAFELPAPPPNRSECRTLPR